MNILLCVGISGSGKSTWATEFLAAHPDYLCINRDALRLSLVKSLKGYYQRPDLNKLEGIVNFLQETILLNADFEGYNVLIDNTNLAQRYINKFVNWQPVNGKLTWQFKLFDCNPTIAKARVLQRDSGDIVVENEQDIENLVNNTNYIDKQAEQYKQIRNYLLTNYKEHEYAEPK